MNLSNLLIEIRYEGKQPTVNHMYGRSKFGRTYLKTEGKEFKAALEGRVRTKMREIYGDEEMPEYEWYALHLTFGVQLHYKNGNKRRWDVSDRVKAVEDAFSDGIGIDDSLYIQVYGEKVDIPHDAEPYTVIRFYGVKGENDD